MSGNKRNRKMRDRQQIAADWAFRGFNCDLWTDASDQRWEDFTHATDELVTVLDGEMEFEVEGQVHHPQPGEELLIPAGAVHSARNIGSTAANWRYGYAKRRAADAARRERKQTAYVEDFRGAVLTFLDFAPGYAELVERLADAVDRVVLSDTRTEQFVSSVAPRLSGEVIEDRRRRGEQHDCTRLLANAFDDLPQICSGLADSCAKLP